MKYILLVFDGMSDYPVDALDGKTPLIAAKTPYMDDLAQRGRVGRVVNHPEGMYAGSDTCNMSILGYDPQKFRCGRGPLEAASIGIDLNRDDVAFRCNLVTTDGVNLTNSNAGHIKTEDARVLVELLHQKLGGRFIQFYPGVSYRHILVWRGGKDDLKCKEPYNYLNQPVDQNLPEGDGEEKLRKLTWDSHEILDNHIINRKRRDEGLPAANMIWLWGQGKPPEFESFFTRYGRTGSVVAAVDLIRGIGRLCGLKVIDVPGATGYIDTNYLGKGEYSFRCLEEDDFVFCHVEAADEAGHEMDWEKKIYAIEQMDEFVLGTILHRMKRFDDFRLLLLPDHPTPVSTGSHSPDPVPFLLFDSREDTGNTIPYDERALEETRFIIDDGLELLRELFRK